MFMDLNMPHMNGFETARRDRNSTRPLRPVPTLARAARATLETRNRGLETGMNGLIAKPLTLTCLESVMDLVRGHRSDDNPSLA